MEQENKAIMNKKFSCFKIFYTAFIIMFVCRFRIAAIRNGLDNSWAYALNLFFDKGIQTIFTYGKLGFLFDPVNMGHNVIFSFLYWLMITISACIIFPRIISRAHEKNMLLSFILLYLGAYIFSMGAILSENVITFMILASLCLCMETNEIKFFVLPCILTLISSFIKFSSAAGDILTLTIFTGLIFLCKDIREALKYLIILCLIPVLWLIIFMLDNPNPSLSGLIYYLRGIYEISSGYISAMSYEVPSRGVYAFLLFNALVLVMLLAVFSFFRVKHSIITAMIFAPSILLAFKHGFAIRHYQFFLPGLFIYLSLYVLFMKDELRVNFRLEKLLKISLSVFFCVTLIMSVCGLNSNPNFDSKEKMNPVKRLLVHPFFLRAINNPLKSFYDQIKNSVQNFYNPDLRANKLIPEFQEIIADKSAAIYPFEISFAADINNYKPMPIFQAYSAYTSRLDMENAKFFSDDLAAPDLILFSLEAIDDRFALLECPETWLEIFKNYRIIKHSQIRPKMDYVNEISYLTEFLLERTESKNLSYSEETTQKFSRDSLIDLPDTKYYSVMNINLRLNLLGRLAKIFFSIPRLDMEVNFSDGRTITRRVLPEVLSNNILISHIPTEDKSFIEIMSGDLNINRVKSFKLTGAGLKYFDNSMEVTFKEFSPDP